MALDPQLLRVEGLYQQKNGRYMQRIKLAAGVISSAQAEVVAEVATRYASGMVHLTTRGSMELHGIEEQHICEIARQFATVGLISRGACGGAVRGISCNSVFTPEYPQLQVLARKLHQHFTQNPHFEGLPKKFKISVEAGYSTGRHLIQDVSIVLLPARQTFDIWVAGGLGKEPQPAFLLDSEISEDQIIPLIEDILNLYIKHAPRGRRLKHLVRELGQEGFRTLLASQRSQTSSLSMTDGFPKQLIHATSSPASSLEVPIFAGQLPAQELRAMARFALDFSNSFLVVTSDQNIAFIPADSRQTSRLVTALRTAGLYDDLPELQVSFRICPGNHDCRMGLVATRDLARELIKEMGTACRSRTWALSGCHNSCSQPQVADIGIFASRLVSNPSGPAQPFFTVLYRQSNSDFATTVAEHISHADLLAFVHELT